MLGLGQVLLEVIPIQLVYFLLTYFISMEDYLEISSAPSSVLVLTAMYSIGVVPFFVIVLILEWRRRSR